MTALKIIFWMLFFIVFYAYVGYGIILYTLVLIKRVLRKSGKKVADHSYEPDVTLFIAAYNEKDFVAEKVKNSLELETIFKSIQQTKKKMIRDLQNL